MEKDLEDLKAAVGRLKMLLDDPRPGLFCWWGFLRDRRLEIDFIMERLGVR